MTTAAMPRPKSENDTPLHLLLPGEWLEDAQDLARLLSRPGAPLTRADALRLALRRGIDVLRAEVRTESSKRSRKR